MGGVAFSVYSVSLPLFPFYTIISIESIVRCTFYLRVAFFYLTTTGWIFGMSLLCENSIKFNQIESNQSIQSIYEPNRVVLV